jgi:outer membrane protein OmpA-like peptidoglycan-associated protein
MIRAAAFFFVGAAALVAQSPANNQDPKSGSAGMDREIVKPSISAERLEQCELVALKRVYFQYDGSGLTANEKSTLTALVNEFSRETRAVIELRGYTDGKEAQSETALGTERSEAIAHFLEAKGVPSSSILLVPTNSTDEQDGSANPEHRRVDVRVFTAFETSGTTQATRLKSPHGAQMTAAR